MNPFKTKLGIAAIGLAVCSAASAITVSYNGPVSAGDVNVHADITFGVNTVTIKLFNDTLNPFTAAQSISDFSLTLASGSTLGSALASSSGVPVLVAADGTYSTGAAISAGWAYSTPNSSTLYLDDLAGGAAGPANTIIGLPDASNVYSNANGGIAGNAPHNPFLQGSTGVTFVITGLTGVTANTQISGAVFSFGTTSGDNHPGGGGTSVPEGGATVALLGLAFTGLIAARRFLK